MKTLTMHPQTGMYPQHGCGQCHKPLNADGGHPAELYAGTYTGLCYACERGTAYRTHVNAFSGAETWSHPPHCPSWRRARETFLYFAGCEHCSHGRIMIYRAGPQGGSYPKQCESCSQKHYRHPHIADTIAKQKAYWESGTKLKKRLSDEWVRACKSAGLEPDTTEPEARALGESYIAQYNDWLVAHPCPTELTA